MASYIGIIHKDADSGYGVSFPDFPGCVTAGKTLDEAGRMAGEVLAGHIAVGNEYGDAIPEPMPLEQAAAHEFARDAVAYIVVPVVTPAADRTVRINLTLRESALRRIDAAAARSGMSRSSYLVRQALG
jgi:predicted RNase H-like HicB family nuclease